MYVFFINTKHCMLTFTGLPRLMQRTERKNPKRKADVIQPVALPSRGSMIVNKINGNILGTEEGYNKYSTRIASMHYRIHWTM